MFRTVAYSANKLAVSKTTIRRMIATGELPAFKVASVIRIRDEDLDAALRRIPVTGGDGEAA